MLELKTDVATRYSKSLLLEKAWMNSLEGEIFEVMETEEENKLDGKS